MNAFTVLAITIPGALEPNTVTLSEFERANSSDPDLIAEVRALRIGDEIDIGGGASPVFTIRRVS